MTTLDTTELKAAAREAGADLVGVADIGRFDGIDPAHHPASIYPEARSVIVLGKRVVRGCLRGVEEGSFLAGRSGSPVDGKKMNRPDDIFLP